jgi:flagellar motor switch protein FliN/FliY
MQRNAESEDTMDDITIELEPTGGDLQATVVGNLKAHAGKDRNLDLIMGIPVSVQVVLGTATMTVANLMKLSRGSVVVLDHCVGEPVDVFVNGHVVARGEVVVVEEENSTLGVSLTEIVGPATAAKPAK